ncbi:MAG: hypothetical protein KBG48_03320 [Kofleriaceae bacterium]|nr:hypothetical protein [Kofleriaceae bacterium]MBP9166384.1 hypothetical protein [Kofleriaceae bacterium]MBP9858625.1 hypothetical protein [Kofleriaceae bacterium]
MTIRLTEQGQGRELLKQYCREAGVSVKVVERLIEIEQAHVGQGRRHGIFQKFDEVFDELVDEPTSGKANVSDAGQAT